MDAADAIRPRKQFLAIFVVLSLLSSTPNVGNVFDETICASKPCEGVKLQNPILLPYAWIFPDKKCNLCNLAENSFAVLYENSFPAIQLVNLSLGIFYLLMLSFFIDFGLRKITGTMRRGKKRKKKR